MAISRITSQDASNATTGNTSIAKAYPGSTAAGHLLIAQVACSNASSDPVISGWTPRINGAIGNVRAVIFSKLADGTETTVTATTPDATKMEMNIFEYQGNANPIVTDGTPAVGTASGASSITTPAITTPNASDLIISMIAQTGGFTSPSWTTSTLIGNNPNIFGGELITSAPQTNFTDTASWATANNVCALICAFQAAATAPAAQFLMYNNVGMGR